MELSSFLDAIPVSAHTFDVQFHPLGERVNHLFASSHVTGVIELWMLKNNQYESTGIMKHHKESCRTLDFFPSGEGMVSGSADCRCAIVNIHGKVIWVTSTRDSKGHNDAVNVVKVLDEKLFASGDDEGCLKIWDSRITASKPVVSFKEYEEYVTSIEYNSIYHPHYLLATSGDCLGVYDMRMPQPKLEAMSDPQEGDLLCCQILRSGSKVVCGSSNGGFISIYNWGDFGDLIDRVPGHGVSVDQLIPIQKDSGSPVCITGAGDGLIRIIQLFPNIIIGALGSHDEEENPIEVLALNKSQTFLVNNVFLIVGTVSGSYDNHLRFHSTKEIDQMIQLQEKSRNDDQTVHIQQQVVPETDFFSGL